MFLFDKIRMKFSKYNKNNLIDNFEAYQQKLLLLTTQEYKIFMLLREGFSKKECSQRLEMKRGDVKNCIKDIYKKLCVKSLAELIMKYGRYS